MEERIEHIRKRPGMYIGRLGSRANEQDGLYNLLKIVFYSLIRQFRESVSDELTIQNCRFRNHRDLMADSGCIPCKESPDNRDEEIQSNH